MTLDPKETVAKANGEVTTTATFSQPGDYVVRVTAVESLASMEQHCCYTNGYVKVTGNWLPGQLTEGAAG